MRPTDSPGHAPDANRRRGGWGPLLGAVVVLSFVAAALVTTAGMSGAAAPAATGPGVTPTQIDIGAIATRTGVGAGDFAGLIPGVQAYFDMVNAHGGINGRKLVLTANLDDGGSPTQFTQSARTILEQDHVFAAFISTYWFTPSLFQQTDTPTYGYNVSDNWAGPANFFAAGGSTQDYHALAAPVAYLMKRTHATSVAMVSYGPGIPGSYPACRTTAQDLAKAGIHVAYTGLDASLGGDFTAEVQQISQSHADFVLSCMQDSDDVTLARAIQQYGLHVHQLWLNGYNQNLLNSYSSLMQGVFVDANGFVPFSADADFPGVYPGMQQYLTAMKKYEPSVVTSQLAMQGWMSAALLAAGVKASGRDLTQKNLIAETNRITDFTAGGTTAVVNWTKAHTTQAFPICPSFIQVRGTTFVPVVARKNQVFICFDRSVDLKDPTPATPPAGTPG
jgi:branched-chain amino acid transport system substrate-binding protein